MAPPVEATRPSFWHRHLVAVSLAGFALLLTAIIVIQLLEQGELQSRMVRVPPLAQRVGTLQLIERGPTTK
ncbi:MAG: hypothetical protein ACRDQZ_15150 [Mycobacteriales bacterium]